MEPHPRDRRLSRGTPPPSLKLEKKALWNHLKSPAPRQPYEGPHIGSRLAKKLDTHRWHVLRIEFLDEPQAGKLRGSCGREVGYALRNEETDGESVVRTPHYVAQPTDRNLG
jgi:hypothetical protein